MRSGIFVILLLSVGGVLGCRYDERNADLDESNGESSGEIAAKQVIDPAQVDVAVDEPSGSVPVVFGAAVQPASVSPGQEVMLVVRAKMADGWHIYAMEGPTGVGRPTQFELTLPSGVIESGGRKIPESKVEESVLGPTASYEGDVRFGIPLKVTPQANAGEYEIICQIAFQACTDSQCLPPSSTQLTIPLTILSD